MGSNSGTITLLNAANIGFSEPDLGPTFGGVLLDELWLLVLDEPIVVSPVRVPDDVVQHNYPLEQQLKIAITDEGLLSKEY